MAITDSHDTLPPSMDPRLADAIETPPTDLAGILRRLGPGLIIAGSIVGSGELIATTKTGAQAGISLLWLVIIGCVIKVFVQVELGRYAITHGETTLSALDRVPGPRLVVNWIVWVWLIMMIFTVAQLGGIVGGVGQSLALTMPIRGDYMQAIALPSDKEVAHYLQWDKAFAEQDPSIEKLSPQQRARLQRGNELLRERLDQLGEPGTALVERIRNGEKTPGVYTLDDKIWAAVATIVTGLLLYFGRYTLIQNLAMVLVVTFTFITIGNVVSLQWTNEYRIPLSEIFRGLSFGLPERVGDLRPLRTALATFGIIGVGATELITYPYWCLEKGYGKFTGPRTDDAAWAERAKGWLKVMRYDAFASMGVYTVATMAFFLMGVAVLFREGRDPEGMRMVSTLATAYVPVFGEYARWLFLSGAVAVLYSTFLVASAGNARMYADGLKVFGLMDRNNERTHERAVVGFSVLVPIVSLSVFCSGADPVKAILAAGISQAVMLPILGIASLYFRRTATDARLKPTKLWDACLLASCLGLLIAGGWLAYNAGTDLLASLGS